MLLQKAFAHIVQGGLFPSIITSSYCFGCCAHIKIISSFDLSLWKGRWENYSKCFDTLVPNFTYHPNCFDGQWAWYVVFLDGDNFCKDCPHPEKPFSNSKTISQIKFPYRTYGDWSEMLVLYATLASRNSIGPSLEMQRNLGSFTCLLVGSISQKKLEYEWVGLVLTLVYSTEKHMSRVNFLCVQLQLLLKRIHLLICPSFN